MSGISVALPEVLVSGNGCNIRATLNEVWRFSGQASVRISESGKRNEQKPCVWLYASEFHSKFSGLSSQLELCKQWLKCQKGLG